MYKRTSPGKERNDSPTFPTTNERKQQQQQQQQQRMKVIRNHSKKNCTNLNTPQLVIVCLMILIGVWGFMGTWVGLATESKDGRSLTQLRAQNHVLSNLRTKPTTAAASAAAPFGVVSEGAPKCHALGSPDDITVTLVTQLSHDRLWMMKHHCDRYRNQKAGPLDQHKMSIAVYSNFTLATILDELREMDCGVGGVDLDVDADANGNANANAKGNPNVEVSVLDAQAHGAYDNFPVNELRNLALSKVQTTHILYIDVDFWPSDDLYETIMGRDDDRNHIRRELFDDPKLALVIPAFQLWRQCREWEDCREENIPHMETARRINGLASEILERKSITMFDPTNRGGHGSTDYKSWFGQPPSTLVDIQCLTSNRYEPFVMVRYCRNLPPFQPAFAGYGKNKVTWMMQVIASGYIFSQVGGAYLVHYPHLDSASRQLWNGGAIKIKATDSPTKKKHTKRGTIDKLFVEFKRWLATTIPADRQRLELCEDAQNDDSKLWVETKPSNPIIGRI